MFQKKTLTTSITLFVTCSAVSVFAAPSAPVSTTPPPVTADGDKIQPAQETVAATTAFATMHATDPQIAKALAATDLDHAKTQIGKKTNFQGTVSKVYSPKDHGIVVLDFAPDYHDAITAVLRPGQYSQFPALKSLTGKHVLLTGTAISYKGVPQIVLVHPDQIQVIADK